MRFFSNCRFTYFSVEAELGVMRKVGTKLQKERAEVGVHTGRSNNGSPSSGAIAGLERRAGRSSRTRSGPDPAQPWTKLGGHCHGLEPEPARLVQVLHRGWGWRTPFRCACWPVVRSRRPKGLRQPDSAILMNSASNLVLSMTGPWALSCLSLVGRRPHVTLGMTPGGTGEADGILVGRTRWRASP